MMVGKLRSVALLGLLGLCQGVVYCADAPARPPKSEVGGRWALLVGVDDYLWARKLEFCGADMRALREQLLASGFPADHVYLLHDKAEENKYRPMKVNIEAHLKILLGLVEPADLVVVGFSGHGLELNGKSYLCPAEAKLSDPATLVSLDAVYEQLQKSRAALKLLLVDACRNDPRPDGERSLAPDDATKQFAQALERPPQGILALTSCAPGEIAREEKSLGHGVFMHYLLEGSQGAADANHNGMVSLMELYLYVNEKTKTYVAQKFVDSQRPSLKGEIHDDFNLLTVGALRPAASSSGAAPVRIEAPSAGALTTNSLGMKFAAIPAGSVKIGSSREEIQRLLGQARALELDSEFLEVIQSEGPIHDVRITRPFYMGAHEVTLGQFRQFMAASGYTTEGERDGKGGIGFDGSREDFARNPSFTWRSPGFPQDENHPVVLVSWNDANQFCRWLSVKESRNYRLPTEAEWEYACRASSLARYSCGDNPETLAEIANTADASARARFPGWELTIAGNDGFIFTAPVGSYRPNAFGLCDMHGNVSEWCSDWFSHSYYARSPAEDPQGPEPTGQRVLRGGSWNSRPQNARAADRGGCEPSDRSCVTGFRLVLVP